MNDESILLFRRGFLRKALVGAAAAGAVLKLGCGHAQACGDELCVPTEPNIEGPFFRPGAPVRGRLAVSGTSGTPLTVTGRVIGRDCQPIPGARIEIWHADDHGEYDNDGFDLRGQLRADRDGAYRLETIIPGRYLNGARYRPAHIHAKVHAPGHETLTTQLYFEGDPENAHDPFIRDSLIMRLADRQGGGKRAAFDFVVG